MGDSRERIRAKEGREFLTSPRQVLRRLMLLSEGRQYREAAGVIGRLGPSVLRSVITELPIDLLLEALPHSAYLLESFFSRLNTVNPSPKPNVPTEAIVWQLVRLFANPHESGLRQRCLKLIQSLGRWDTNLRQTLKERRKSLDQAIQGLGVHGLTADYNGKLISLHIALKNELNRHIETYKIAVHKLDELSTITLNKDPAQSSHQRLLAISYADIQQRLIINKTLLTILDKPDLKQLDMLLKNLSERVQNDKEVLLGVGQIRRLDPQSSIDERPAAGLLMNFSRGCNAVLTLMGPESQPSSPSGSDGYHSDSDTAIDEMNNEIVRQYRCFYNENRSNTLEALNSLPQLKQVPNLKAKILFSIIVLSFRACSSLRERKILDVRRLLCCPMESVSADNETVLSLDRSIRKYLHDTTATYPMGDIERQVSNQVLSTLHEYPCLESCTSLVQFISQCVRLSWKMVNQNLQYYLDNDFTLGFLCPEKHERYSQSADKRSDLIKTFLWPALMQNHRCVVKAIVTT